MELLPVANMFPQMSEMEYEAFKNDIRRRGQIEPIRILNGKIVDGRHQYRACKELGIEPRTVDCTADLKAFKGSETEFVVSLNMFRRHLSESQRALIAAKLTGLASGEHESNGGPIGPPRPLSNASAAEALRVGKSSVKRARKVQEKGSKELKQAVDTGEITVSAAEQVVELPMAQQLPAAKTREKPAPNKIDRLTKRQFYGSKVSDLVRWSPGIGKREDVRNLVEALEALYCSRPEQEPPGKSGGVGQSSRPPGPLENPKNPRPRSRGLEARSPRF